MALEWEAVSACDFCGGTDSRTFLRSDVPPWYSGQPINLLECTDCRLVRADPRPERTELYRNYLRGAPNVRALVERKLARPNVNEPHRRAIEEAKTFCDHPAMALFDMGCGAGTAMVAARDLGLTAEGNDINKAAVQMLRTQGFNARLGFTKDVRLGTKAYDIVLNLDYLEHSYEPFQDLETCYRILKPGGVLYLKTFYIGSPGHVADGEAWKRFGKGQFHSFRPETLRAMVERAEFRILDFNLGNLATVIAAR